MSQIYDALRKAEQERDRSLVSRIWRMVPRLMAARPGPAPVRAEPDSAPVRRAELPPPAPALPAFELDAELHSLRHAVDRIESRLSHEMVERDGKLLEELRRGMLGLEASLSERFSDAVLANRRALRRMYGGVLLLFAFFGGVVAVILAL